MYFTKELGKTLPPISEGDQRYIVAANGIFMERRTDLYHSCARIQKLDDDLPFLAEQQPSLKYSFSLPVEIIRDAVNFLGWIISEYGSKEGALLILYHPVHGFTLECPEQDITLGDVEFKNPDELPLGWVRFGDIHSHPGMSATPSVTDISDEEHLDGLHIIVGKPDKKKTREFHAAFTVDGTRFVLPKAFIPQFDEPDFSPPPDEWKEKITAKKYGSGVGGAGNNRGWQSGHFLYDDYADDHHYDRTSSGVKQHGRTGYRPTRPSKKYGAGRLATSSQYWEKDTKYPMFLASEVRQIVTGLCEGIDAAADALGLEKEDFYAPCEAFEIDTDVWDAAYALTTPCEQQIPCNQSEIEEWDTEFGGTP